MPRFVLENEHGEAFDSATLDGTWRIIFFYSRGTILPLASEDV